MRKVDCAGIAEPGYERVSGNVPRGGGGSDVYVQFPSDAAAGAVEAGTSRDIRSRGVHIYIYLCVFHSKYVSVYLDKAAACPVDVY